MYSIVTKCVENIGNKTTNMKQWFKESYLENIEHSINNLYVLEMSKPIKGMPNQYEIMLQVPLMSATVITITANNNNNNTGDVKFLVRRQDFTSPMFYFHLVVKRWNDSWSWF